MSNNPNRQRTSFRPNDNHRGRAGPHRHSRRRSHNEHVHHGFFDVPMLDGETVGAWRPEGITTAFLTECFPEDWPNLLEHLQSQGIDTASNPMCCGCPAHEVFTGVTIEYHNEGAQFCIWTASQVLTMMSEGVQFHNHPLGVRTVKAPRGAA